MQSSEPQFLTAGSGGEARAIAYRADPAQKPGTAGVFWLSGFMSDMGSTKVAALGPWAEERGRAFTRFDYSGHGLSGGEFQEGTIGRWLEEAETVFRHRTSGPQIIVGSSMGGHIALILLRKLIREAQDDAARIKGLVLIAPAWDMTEELMWKKFTPEIKQEILDRGFHLRPSAYAAPYTITRKLIEDGRQHLLAREPFNPERPVIILQGLLDPDVPAAHTRELTTFLTGSHVRLIEIADAEHRLSRPQDLEKLFAAIDAIG